MGLCDFSSVKIDNDVQTCKETQYTLWLQHTKEYSLVNAYNLAVMSILAYSDVNTDKETPDRDVAHFLKNMKEKKKLTVFKKDQKKATTSVNQFVKEVSKDKDKAKDKGINTEGHMIDKASSTEAFWFADKENIVLAVRGTQEINKDIILSSLMVGSGKAPDDAVIDLDGEQVTLVGIQGQVHRGFKTQAEAIISQIKTFEDSIGSKKLFITGHSLGAAVATILSAYLKDKGHDPLLYTYGSPRVGNEDFVKAYANITHYRHVYQHDIVPIVPGRNLDMGISELKLCATPGIVVGIANPVLGLGLLSSSLYLCSQNLEGPGYYHHGDLCQIISAGSKSIMNSFESHGIVNDRIRKILKQKEESLARMQEIHRQGSDLNSDGYTSGEELSGYLQKYQTSRNEAEKALKPFNNLFLADDRHDDTSIMSTLLNGKISDHFMNMGYLPFLKEEIKTQWKLYKQNYCTETSAEQNKSSSSYQRIKNAIVRCKKEIAYHAMKSIPNSDAIRDQMATGRIDMAHRTEIIAKRHEELKEKIQRDLKKLEKMLDSKIGTHSLYSLRKSELELNKQLEKFSRI